MSLTRIYNSKLYLTNSRKDRIHAALQDPLNIELVQQVSDYLDDESKEDLVNAVNEKRASEKPKEPKNDANDEVNVFDDNASGGSHGSAPAMHSHAPSGGGGFSGMPDLGGEMPEGEGADNPEAPASDEGAPEDAPDDNIAESTEISADGGMEVTSAEEKPVIQSGIIKKLLNDQDDTKGVVRVDPTDDEVWIYYEDKVNLNDVMDNVITLIKNTYDALKFSRLARTDNAVVFDIKE